MNSQDIDAFKLDHENEHIIKLYDKQEFSRSCMLAGRLVERGVRYVKVELGGWDYHDQIYGKLPSNASKLDKGLSSLLMHLSQKDFWNQPWSWSRQNSAGSRELIQTKDAITILTDSPVS